MADKFFDYSLISIVGIAIIGVMFLALATFKQADKRRQIFEHCIADGNKDYICYNLIYQRTR